MGTNRLADLAKLGQSIWYDNIRRGLITSGDLQRLIDEDAVVGVTSNPTIFEKAIDGSSDYDDAIRRLVASGVTDGQQIFEALAVEDIQMAADVLRPVYDRSDHGDGYISLEVSPAAANDTKRTIAEARHLFKRAARPNVMIKIPATLAGLPAIEQMIYEGVNINVTLIFSLERYEAVAEAFIRGLEHRASEGQPVGDIASVASFFVSRVDTMVDKLLDEKMGRTDDVAVRSELESLHGKAAIANARLAYAAFKRIFHGDRFAGLRAAGAKPQRCLWASTSAKNPAYRDVLYVEQLVGPETVDTMPPQTIVAFQDHGEAALTLDADDIGVSKDVMRRLQSAGINMAKVTRNLEVEGVKLFADSYDKLIASTKEKADRLRAEARRGGSSGGLNFPQRQKASLGSLQTLADAAIQRADADHISKRLWNKDSSLWTSEAADPGEIANRLGWLSVSDKMCDALPRLYELRDEVRQAGFTTCVLLGMGGSSLAPEVLSATFGVASGQPNLIVLDSTDPSAILDVQGRLDLPRTLFVVASKSGSTIETLSHFKHFYRRMQDAVGDDASSHFIAITDAGTKLDAMAEGAKFRQVFRNPDDIGGRYSALSYFGLVPAAIIGADISRLLDRAINTEHACAPTVPTAENPGVWLGAVLAALAENHHDKLTLVVSPPIAAFGQWVEQLLAEGTGKQGKGILPVVGEDLAAPEAYGSDRLFVYCRTDEGADSQQDEAIAALERGGQPVVTLRLKDRFDLGSEFFRWEFATAAAGALLGVNPFDQPNVQEAKDHTAALLDDYRITQTLAQPPAILRTEHVAIVADEQAAQRLVDAVSLQAALEVFVRQARPGDYIALLAFLPHTPALHDALQHIRLRLRDLTRVATTLGYGPRYLHSTGQFHKGGPDTGLFIQLVADAQQDVPIPDEPYTFAALEQAQALGDFQALRARGRRAIRLRLDGDPGAGLEELREALAAAQVRPR